MESTSLKALIDLLQLVVFLFSLTIKIISSVHLLLGGVGGGSCILKEQQVTEPAQSERLTRADR